VLGLFLSVFHWAGVLVVRHFVIIRVSVSWSAMLSVPVQVIDRADLSLK